MVHQWNLTQHPVCQLDGSCRKGEAVAMKGESIGTVKYILNSPYLVIYLQNNPGINIFSFIKDEKAVFADDYAMKTFHLDDLSVLDI